MDEISKIIGALEAHQEHTDRRFDALEKKVDALQKWSFTFAGGAAVISVLVIKGIEIASAIIH